METKATQTHEVDEYMDKFSHTLKNVLEELRALILKTDKDIGEEIKWNAPAFFYSGQMEPSNPKEYKKYIAVSNVHKQDHIMLIFLHAADVDNGSGFLEGEYTDGRRLLKFYSLEDVKNKKKELIKVIKSLLEKMK